MNERWERMERTMQFILDQQARAEARLAEAEERRAEYEAKAEARRIEEEARRVQDETRWAKADRQIAQIRRMLLSAIGLGRRERTEINEKIAILIKGQVELQDAVKAFLKRATNGSTPA